MRSRALMRQAMLDILVETPLENVTGSMIAERAGVGYATYFRHYADVHNLLVDTVGHLADELTARMLPSLAAARTGEAAGLLVDAVAARRETFTALLSGAGDATRGMLTRYLFERMEALPDLPASWLPERLAIRFAIVGTIEILDWWLREATDQSAAQIAAMLDRLVIASLSDR